ncbi:hypothetical protein COT48_02105 [Candidatus Woesearchaeota archaeon CG08_land_8_20_14_0_20_47_9]|nr:MAG: hypothetical protein COT48_02105 [Candidatus Woesearchaeota archaeon CG08_land_8_20_14_0_20_47_9]
MKEIAISGGIGSAIAALLFITVNVFLPSGLSIFSIANNPEVFLGNLPTLLIIAVVCEIIGVILGFLISFFTDLFK